MHRPLPLARPSRSASALLLVGALAIGLLSACSSSDASTRADAGTDDPTTTAAQVTVPATIPAGTTLHIGDQLDYLKTVLEVSGQDQGLDYKVDYASFVGGPPMLQAFKGGSVDAGFVASTPLIFAQASGQDITAVAGWAPEKGLGGVISVDGSVKSWADLKGKKVAYQRGTSAEAAVLGGLDEAGLTLDDITTVDVPITQINATLAGGSADAGVTTEPLISLFLADHPKATVGISPSAITDRASFLIAAQATLDDAGKTAALADYTGRLVKAFQYLNDHKAALATAVFVKQYGLTPDRATELVNGGNGDTTFFPLPGKVLEPQQQLADQFVAAGQIPNKIDVGPEFDGRFNDIVAEAQGS
ncbi:ABC transporter substrate-binding protein [Aquihabitans sp. McL0605]|uniref:ABC transporter substrate-binding protein n=1 Tax=Aquihabitans sp. McL0605 TaxID=3415671 RepID=UPI003CF82B5D